MAKRNFRCQSYHKAVQVFGSRKIKWKVHIYIYECLKEVSKYIETLVSTVLIVSTRQSILDSDSTTQSDCYLSLVYSECSIIALLVLFKLKR